MLSVQLTGQNGHALYEVQLLSDMRLAPKDDSQVQNNGREHIHLDRTATGHEWTLIAELVRHRQRYLYATTYGEKG